MKAAVLPGTPVSSILPSATDIPRIPLEILQKRVVPTATGSVEQGLIRWSGWSHDMATWENLLHLHQLYPRAPAWGQADPQEPGNVTSSPISILKYCK